MSDYALHPEAALDLIESQNRAALSRARVRFLTFPRVPLRFTLGYIGSPLRGLAFTKPIFETRSTQKTEGQLRLACPPMLNPCSSVIN